MFNFNKTPKNKNRRDFLILSFISLILIPTSIFTHYITTQEENFEFSNFLPEVYIECECTIHSDNYVSALFKSHEFGIPIMIKYRGRTNNQFAKKGYRLEFSKDFSLFKMRFDDDWQLFANYLDHTRMRTKLAFDLWRSLLPSNPTAILPKSEFVTLFINNTFEGLYLLSEKQDRRLFGLDKAQNNLNSSLILQNSNYHHTFKYLVQWEQDYPNREDGIYIADQIIEDLTLFINNTSNQEFFDKTTGIFTKFDKMNLIDFYLFNFFILHNDFWSKNFYLVRNSMPSKFFLIPWDFDGSFGQYGWIKYDSNTRDYFCRGNVLFERLVQNEEFIQEVNLRWVELRANLWTKEYIIELISKMYNEIQDVLEIDLEMWKPITVDGYIEKKWPDIYLYSNDEFNLNEAIDFLYDWIEGRLVFCDSFFS
ncbi:MAG: CotH kinase family protein [Promethearchaeota archaeon]